MGGSSTKQTTNQQQSATTSLPQWLTDAGQQTYNNAVGSVKPTTAYTGQMTAPMSSNQQQAASAASSAVGTGQADMNAARDYTAAATSQPQMQVKGANSGPVATYTAAGQGAAPSVSTGTFTADQAAKYANPYTQQVQANTLKTMDLSNGADHQALNDSVQASKAFGGTRGALLESELAKNQSITRQNYVDSSNADAYNAAHTAFEADQQRALAAGTTNAGFLNDLLGRTDAANAANASATNTAANDNANRAQAASTTNATNQQSMLDRLLAAAGQSRATGTAANDATGADIGRLVATGATQQDTQNASDAAKYQDYLRTQSGDLNQWSQIMSILNGTPVDKTTTGTSSGSSTTQQNAGFLNTMMGLGSLGVSAFSDPRLKKDVSLIERLANGLGIYRFRYLWERSSVPQHIGVMADEVASIMPEALGPVVSGYLTVNYDKLGGLLA